MADKKLPSYGDYNENAGLDFIIPSRSENIAEKRCKIIDIEERETQAGKAFPLMTLQNMNRTKFQIPAWTRDVAELCKQWGTNPSTWLQKDVTFGIQDGRLILLPLNIIEEEQVK